MSKSRQNTKRGKNLISRDVYSVKKLPIVFQTAEFVVVHKAGEGSALIVYEKSLDGEYSLVPDKFFFNLEAAKSWIEGRDG